MNFYNNKKIAAEIKYADIIRNFRNKAMRMKKEILELTER